MTLEEIVAKIENAGFSWAAEHGPNWSEFRACVRRDGRYVADGLSIGLGIGRGATLAEALENGPEG